MKKQGLLVGTALLLVSNIFVKGLGFVYRVALVRLLGAEGMGLAEMVSPLFSFLLVLAGCGVQTALAQSIAAGQEPLRYMKAGLLILLMGGGLTTALAYGLAPLLVAHLAPDPRILLCFQAVLPALPIICAAAVLRGLFQGQRQVAALGMAQNIEQIIRVIVGLTLAARLLPLGLESAVSAVSLATVAGEGAGLAWLLLCWKRGHSGVKSPHRILRPELLAAARELLRYGLPLTGSRLAASAIALAQAFLIPACLQQAGWSCSAATEIYGRYSGVAMSLLHLPGVFTAALTVSVLPTVAESLHSGNQGQRRLLQRVTEALYATLLFTLPGLILLFCEAEALCTLIFDNAPAAPLLMMLAPGGIFLYLQVTLTGVLQGLGKVRELLCNNIIAGLVLLAGIWLLTPLPAWGVKGAALAATASWMIGLLLHLRCWKQASGQSLPWGLLLGKTLPAGAAAWAVAELAQFLLPAMTISAALQRMALAAAAYIVVLLVNGGWKLRTP